MEDREAKVKYISRLEASNKEDAWSQIRLEKMWKDVVVDSSLLSHYKQVQQHNSRMIITRKGYIL